MVTWLRSGLIGLGAMLAVVLLPSAAWAEGPAPSDGALFVINNTWMLIATILVFIMHLGFATLEAGLAQAKNTVNVLFKNVSVLSIGVLTYALCGFGLMYPGAAFEGGVFGFAGFGIGTGAEGLTSAYNPAYTYWTDFLFQAMFAATAATIVSGAVAERVKLKSFLLFATVYVAVVYPIAGMWQWGKGWLSALGFHDFAGSTLVHSVGGWAALVAIILLGPRIGRFAADGTPKPIPGHSDAAGDDRGVPAVAGVVRVQRRLGAERRSRSGGVAGAS
jgi:Amt family ammonium transporter